MILDVANTANVSKLISQQVENVTCLECCKFYIAPETATCGHTLCQLCWKRRRVCPVCTVPVERQVLKLNTTMQTLAEHVCSLGEAFEKLFKIKLDDLGLDVPPVNEVETENDPTKNVTDWLLNSQNHFSTLPTNSQQFSQEHAQSIDLSTDKIQIHSNTKKTISPVKVIHVAPPQIDWDKIEAMPDTEGYANNKENVVGPTDIEPFFFDEEYTTKNPRRSSRQKELKIGELATKAHGIISDNKHSSISSNNESDKKFNKTKQNWNNVKKMRKEFSKLNRQNRNKLNVSIEMCKKTQLNKPNLMSPVISQQACYNIDDNTPTIINNEKEKTKVTPESKQITDSIITSSHAKADHDSINNRISTNDDVNLTDNCNLDIDTLKSNLMIIDDINLKTKEVFHEKNHNIPKNIKSLPLPTHNLFKNEKQIELTKIPFFKKSSLQSKCFKENITDTVNDNVNSTDINTHMDDIEITIKVGNTLTNIYIKKKNNDVQLQIKTDREVQANLDQQQSSCNMQETHINIDNNKNITNKNRTQNIIQECINTKSKSKLNKITSTKKNTDSAETVTAQFEITESEEKELSNVMKHIESENNNIQPNNNNLSQVIKNAKPSQVNAKIIQSLDRNLVEIPEDMEYLNDLDIFESGSIKESNVQLLKNTKSTPSEILISTVKSNKNRIQKHPEKREREVNDENEMLNNKKTKYKSEMDTENIQKDEEKEPALKSKNQNINHDVSMQYDVIMSQKYANIDEDIKNIHSNHNIDKNKQNLHTQNVFSEENIPQNKDLFSPIEVEQNTSNLKENIVNHKCSENTFPILNKDNEIHKEIQKQNDQIPGPETQKRIEDLLTPGMCRDLVSTHGDSIQDDDVDIAEQELGTPLPHDDSDKSVVEETPQKNLSFSKMKQKNDISFKGAKSDDRHLFQKLSDNKQRSAREVQKVPNSQEVKSVINLLDSLPMSNKNVTVIKNNKKQTLETPLTINKFVDHITYKSTPMARKSLNFANEDHDQTLCSSSQVATTTQEKEFINKAFELTPKSSEKGSLLLKNFRSKENKKFCIAGSCLTSAELANVKKLCTKREWTYTDKYTKDLTHLVVGVDEENKSQRSVKYMCALASGKWIISYTWVEKSLQTQEFIGEEPYEVLDWTGDPGPKRSRTTKQKLFQGITFYCMPPFSVLDVDTLKGMLEAAGGCVVNEARGVCVTNNKPALLLAEPEHTQEDRFIYLAMELSIVPVNYEWALNCLGSYTLGSVHELLLCPASLLPAATTQWPAKLLTREDD